MEVVITGGAGFLGTQLVQALLAELPQEDMHGNVNQFISADLTPSPVSHERVKSYVGDITDQAFVNSIITPQTGAIFHLAAVLSGGAEANFDAALKINLDATRLLLNIARERGTQPLFIFTSSLAVFGGNLPAIVPPSQGVQPNSTYGATKAMGELLVNEYSRRGYIDGRICRLPTISVRPGAPNSAASSFASGIIREPLNGLQTICPVPHETRMWLASPQTVVANLIHALRVPADSLPSWRVLNFPGISVTVEEMLESLENSAGADVKNLVTDQLTPAIMDIVCSWPGNFDTSLETSLGFKADTSFTEIIEQYKTHFLNPKN